MDFTIARKNNGGAILWSEDQVRYIINEYVENDKTLKEISQKFGVQTQSIRNLLRKNDIEITNKKTSKYPRNSNYFETIDSHEKAYWLGIMLSDGSVTSGNSVNLGLKDYEHIEKYQRAIGALNNKIITITDDRYSPPAVNYRLSVKDAKMAKDLAQYNCVPNKSYIEFGFPNIPEQFYGDFIRGYFDGDGSIYFTNNKYILSFVGNKTFLNDLKNVLGKENITLCQNVKSKITYDLKICGKKDVIRVLNFMYETSTEETRLDRKYITTQKCLSS